LQRCDIVYDDCDELQNIDGNQPPVVVIGSVKKRPLYDLIRELNVPPEAEINRITSSAVQATVPIAYKGG
jgi:hypothetical protein